VNIISFSLYGFDRIYVDGLLRSIKSSKKLLPDYCPVVYLSNDFDLNFSADLENLGAKVIHQEKSWPINGMFWRFLAVFQEEADRVLIRDCDSDIHERDVAAVRDWETSGLPFHIMRDHPLHFAPILGGMWGAMAPEARELINLKEFYSYNSEKGEDQKFLSTLYPKIFNQALVHDSFFKYEKNSQEFPTARIESEYVGEALNSEGLPLSPEATKILQLIEASIIRRSILKFRFAKYMRNIKKLGSNKLC